MLHGNKEVCGKCQCGGQEMLYQVFCIFISCFLYAYLRSLKFNPFFELPITTHSENNHISKIVIFQRVINFFTNVIVQMYLSILIMLILYKRKT